MHSSCLMSGAADRCLLARQALHLPAFSFQCLLIGCMSIKWEPEHIIAAGPRRPLRICCQFFVVAIPLLLSAVFAYLTGERASACPPSLRPH
jgi:hypothetical protein